MTLNIAWITGRKNGCFEWFADSLRRETGGDYTDIRVIVVDFWAEPNRSEDGSMFKRILYFGDERVGANAVITPPKPCVWQGPHRLTSKDYFAASNARNTAICYAKDGWIAFVDDLSVLMPGWLKAAREAIAQNYIACGAYQKVCSLIVEDGLAKSWDSPPRGVDPRWVTGDDAKAVDCPGCYLFGCSVLAPVEAFLKINGWPEACDSTGVGAEDPFTGNTLEATGHKLKYDRRMFTLESEELHHIGNQMHRCDKGNIGTPDSKSHACVRMLTGAKRFDNDFHEYPDLAALRQHILAGGEFPLPRNPRHDWYSGQSLSEL
jgi:hypothetical protein